MARNRLFVDEILSIGMVAAGDNPDAEVLLFKARDFDKEPREPTLNDYRRQLEEIRKDHRHWEEVDRIEHRQKDTNMPSKTPATDALIAHIEKDRARAQGEEVADDFDEMVAKKLEAWAGRRQIENEIAGKYGSLSTPRIDQRVKIKALWWQSPDGQLVKDKLRDKTSAGQDGELIVKSLDGETAAALSRLDG
jgi:hypothetical protein